MLALQRIWNTVGRGLGIQRRKDHTLTYVQSLKSKCTVLHPVKGLLWCKNARCQLCHLYGQICQSYFCFLMQCSSLIFFLYYFIGFRWPTACDEWSSWSELKTEFAISQLINTFYLHLLWKKAPTLQGIKSCYKLKTKRAQLCLRCLLYSWQRYQPQKHWQLWVLKAKLSLN